MNNISTLLITLLLSFGCTAENNSAISFWSTADPDFTPSKLTMRQQLERIEKANPEADAKKAYDGKDKRYFAIMGIALTTPGVNRIKENELKVISWTSDAIENDLHMKLNKAASNYAKRYNLKLRELKENQPNQAAHTTSASARRVA